VVENLYLKGYKPAEKFDFCVPKATFIRNVAAQIPKQKRVPRSREKPASYLTETGPPARPFDYFTAPPSNHAAIFMRSSSVMCVTLPSGIAFNVTAC